MNRLFVMFVAAMLTAGLQMTSAQHSAAQADKLLASAHHKATVNGDLKGAIADYTKIVATAGGNRALAAEALVRMAECYQKLGDAEAQKIYARLVREYGDQKEASALARTRLGTTGSGAILKGDRSVWTAPNADGFGTISPDGRFLTYTDWQTGSLMLRELVTAADYRLTTGGYAEGMTQFSAISKDGRQLAYQWMDTKAPRDARRFELRVAKLHATGMSESRRLFDNPDVTGAAPYDWSPDGKWIAVHVGRKDLTGQIALIGVQDGTLRALKTIDWDGPTKIFFSPDGKYIAYDLMVADKSHQRNVYVMAVDGSRETVAVEHASLNVIMGWSPDGRQLLFASDRSGSFGLWAVPVADGKPHGTAMLLKPDIGSSWSLGMATSGTMYVWKYSSPTYIQSSSIDLEAGKLVSGTPMQFQRFIGSRGRPDWSSDGKQLAYQSCAPLGGGPCTLWIRSVDTGELREVKVNLAYFFFPRWSPDGREFVAQGRDMKGRQGLYRINAQTGDTTLVAGPSLGSGMLQWAAEGKQVYYQRDAAIIARDSASGAEREMVRLPKAAIGQFAISPDGRNVAYNAEEPAGVTHLFVMPVAGGTSRSLLRLNAPERLVSRFDWTSDGRGLVVAKEDGSRQRKELWLVPANDEKPRKLDIEIDNWKLEDGFRLDRAGKQIAFVAAAGKPGMEIRALENFLPAQTSVKPSTKR